MSVTLSLPVTMSTLPLAMGHRPGQIGAASFMSTQNQNQSQRTNTIHSNSNFAAVSATTLAPPPSAPFLPLTASPSNSITASGSRSRGSNSGSTSNYTTSFSSGTPHSTTISFQAAENESLRKWRWEKLVLFATSLMVLAVIVFSMGLMMVKTPRVRNSTSAAVLGHLNPEVPALALQQNKNHYHDYVSLTSKNQQHSPKCYRKSDGKVAETVHAQILVLNPKSNSDQLLTVSNNMTLSTLCGNSLKTVTRRMDERKDINFSFKWKTSKGVNSQVLSINDIAENPSENLYWTIYIFENDHLFGDPFQAEVLTNKHFSLSQDLDKLQIESKVVSIVFWLQKISVENRIPGSRIETVDANSNANTNESDQLISYKDAASTYRTWNISTTGWIGRNQLIQILLFLKAILV